jgi:hypothetical protein
LAQTGLKKRRIMEANDLLNAAELPLEDSTGKKKSGGRGAARQTLYRVTVRNQLRSISIADQKANILIGINTILISIIITILGVESTLPGLRFISELDLNVPLLVFLLACFGSGYIAVLVVRPAKKPWKSNAPGKIFFKNYDEIELGDFKGYIDDIMESGQKIYDSLNTDMYLFGKTIIRKYNYLRVAYTIFIVGLVSLVVSFFIFRFLF